MLSSVGVALINAFVFVASICSLRESQALTTVLDVTLVLTATGGLDFILVKAIRANRSASLDSNHPRWHFISALLSFVMATASSIYFGLSYYHVTAVVSSDALATVAIAGMTVPAGATLVLAAAALPKRSNENQ